MRTISKIVLVIVLIILVYSLVKLISAATIKGNTFSLGTWDIRHNQNNAVSAPTKQESQNIPSSPDTPNAQGLYQADEILINGQGKAGQNYIDITSDTPITPEPQNTANTQNNNSGGAYAQASVTIDHNNNIGTSAQSYAPGEPAFEVIDGD